jgi:septum site-determining protein MinD
MVDQARHQFDFIVCDSPAGIEHGAQMAMFFADDAVLVATPELPSVRDTDRMLGLITEKSYRSRHGLTPVRPHLIINRYNPDTVGDSLSPDSIIETLDVPLLGVIPENAQHVTRAANRGEPVILDSGSAAGKAYVDTVSRFLDEDVPIKFAKKRKAIWKKLFWGSRGADID